MFRSIPKISTQMPHKGLRAIHPSDPLTLLGDKNQYVNQNINDLFFMAL